MANLTRLGNIVVRWLALRSVKCLSLRRLAHRKFSRTSAQWVASILLPLSAGAAVTTGSGVMTNPLNLQPLVRQAYHQFYILDYDGALAKFEKVQAEHPDDPMAVDYVLNATLFRELYRLDLLDTTFYAHDGFLTGKHAPASVDPVVRDRIRALLQKALDMSNDRIGKNASDVDALYARAWARSLDAIYLGLIDRSFVSALHVALQARGDDEKVLDLAPNYVDAKLVVGVHEYVVGSLPFAFKLLAGIVGVTGSKKKGLADLRDAGARGVITSVEARTALGLFLRREADYRSAISVVKSLRDEYPRDMLFHLEVANLMKDGGDGPKAIEEYRALLNLARKPGYFPSAHLELPWFGLGEALRGQRDYREAAAAYIQAATQPTISATLRARCNLNAGEMLDLLGQREEAKLRYSEVLQGNADSAQSDAARKFLKSPFRSN